MITSIRIKLLEYLCNMKKPITSMNVDEKVFRVIQVPLSFVKTINKFKGIDSMEINQEGRPFSAALPTLGLSNKVVSQHKSYKFVTQNTEAHARFLYEIVHGP
ncbi:hypothetical protein PIROE2DRAFT_1414 [Piromyces sp. E2]|nr:hypothetical protein PIROE2DRAFT_1414 [Piromyces sp. E2]|eukprot:OUM70532.1 hypothetical protein PIROE2DRAFT_1414 [Piromyces sp. E2]